MFCKNCGNKIEENSKFCISCGDKINEITNQKIEEVKSIENTHSNVKEKILFYSLDLERIDGFTISATPLFDILITDNFLYLIQLPLSLLQDIGSISNRGPLMVFGGLVGGLARGVVSDATSSSSEKSLNKARQPWIDLNMEYIPQEYQKITFLKIPKEKIIDSVSLCQSSKFKKVVHATKDSIKFKYDNKKITLQCEAEEFQRLEDYIKNKI